MGILPMLIFAYEARPDSLKQYWLQPVRVIASGESASISPITRVVNPPDNTQVSELLKQSPGISISYGSRDESNLRIRGFRKNESLILVNGRPLNSGYFGNVDLSKILSDDISEIRIIKGPASAVYGGGTMGGVVNIITQPQDHYLSLQTDLSRNLKNSQNLSSARQFRNWSYQISGGREERTPPVLPEDFEPTPFENGKVRDHSYQESWFGKAGLDFLINDLHELGISGGYTRIPYKEIPSSIYSRDYRVYRDWFKADASLAWDYFSSLESNLRGQLYMDAAGDTFERYLDSGHQNLSLSSRMESYNWGISPVYEHRGSGILSTGLRLEYRGIKRRDTGSYIDWTHNDAFVGSAFSQYQKDLSGALSLSISAGLTSFSHSKNRELKFIAEPSAGLYVDHPDGSNSSLSLGLNSALPTMRQLFSADHGNPDLKASRALKSELNHQRRIWADLIAEMSIFYNDVRDLIDRRGEQYANIYRVQSWGGEFSLSARILQIWELSGQYSALIYSGDYGLSDSAPHSVNIQNRIQLPLGLALDIDSQWRSRRDSMDSVSVLRELPAYHTHAVGLSKSWKNLDLTFSLQNLLDHDYESEYGYPAPGKDFVLQIKYTLK